MNEIIYIMIILFIVYAIYVYKRIDKNTVKNKNNQSKEFKDRLNSRVIQRLFELEGIYK